MRKIFITKLHLLCCAAKANNADFVLCVSMVLVHDSDNDDEGVFKLAIFYVHMLSNDV